MSNRFRRIACFGFIAYAIILFVATHKPGVQVNVVPGIRLDLFIHMAAFGMWTVLLGLTGWLPDPRRATGLAVLMAVGVGYAVIDESSQALPIFDRVFDLADMTANALGAAAAALGVFVVFRTRTRREPEA